MSCSKTFIAVAISSLFSGPLLAVVVVEDATNHLSQLEAVTVTATALEDKKSTTTNSTVINAKQLEQQQVQRLEDMVRYIPGVSLTDQGRFGSAGFNIRGLEGNQVAITVDGLSVGEALNPPSFAFYDFFAAGRGGIDPDAVKQIEIVKGADAIAAGSGSLGGAVLFVTKDAADYLAPAGNDTFIRLKAAFSGANDETQGSVTVANRTGKLEALAVLTQRKGHEMENYRDSAERQAITGSGRPVADPQDNSSHNVLTKLKYQLTESQDIGLTAELFKADINTNNLSWLSRSYLTRNSDDQQQRSRIGLTYNWLAGQPLFDAFSTSVDFQKTNNDAFTLMLAPASAARLCTTGPCYRSEDRDYQQDLLKWAVALDKELYTQGSSHQLVYGGALEQKSVDFSAIDTSYVGQTMNIAKQDIDPDFVPETDADLWHLYLRDSIKFHDSAFSLTAGMRYDHVSYKPQLNDGFTDVTGTVQGRSFSAVTGQLVGNYQLTEQQSVALQLGRGFRAPSTEEMYFQTALTSRTEKASGVVVPGLYSSLSNPNLEAEYSTNLELAYQWQSDNSRIKVAVFKDNYSDMITTATKVQNPGIVYEDCSSFGCNTTQGNPFTINENIGDVDVTGIELQAAWRFNQSWSTQFSYSHHEGEKDNGDPLITISPDKLVAGVSYHATDWWDVAANLSYSSDVKTKDAFETQANGTQQQLVTYLPKSATVVDLVSNIEFADNWLVNIGIYNLLDKEYYRWERIRFVASSRNNISADGIQRYSEPGRYAKFSVSYSF
ncbi:MAG: TonB-dependent hemoglobin/transferrin/lactoferrin family receptor [Gammaproteobacteria bacterium]|nr:TonB-dependent hemoglobin/transferrin/lactoferrin family receptor [Gammaproteobacteria bacterium]MBU2223333.1 TonB-dependent hemoglobin/transferrin/lactoferrin family receptor [Gammaproteobacteria bacterium]MBU2277842.1 TonB-dependent hemoglobin/transferrin/lactoferrin family receptor [Gammaproteobacteria bacterium]MBU2426651.1 TonB-dependent hemoglobin/transferrin/lactoferrin family receptor [Gammaproteobacteria bacterium]